MISENMIGKKFSFDLLRFSLLLATMLGASYAAAQSEATPPAGSPQPAAVDVKGTWSGTFFSKHSNVAPFTMTVVIDADSERGLVGSSSLNSDCLKDVQLQVTVTGSKVELAGSSKEGNNITLHGTVDKKGSLMKATYILNGSATGKCETDDGTGTFARH